MEKKLNGLKVAILVADGFEQVEMTEPRKALEGAGAQTFIISPKEGKVKGWKMTDWGDEFNVDIPLQQANPDDYEALLLPGGQINPDKLRAQEEAVAFVKSFFDKNKPVGAICHAPWLLVEAGVLEGRRCTSYHSIRTDVKNAGALWVDEKAVVDGNLVTSRNPDDIPAFSEKIIEEFAMAGHEK